MTYTPDQLHNAIEAGITPNDFELASLVRLAGRLGDLRPPGPSIEATQRMSERFEALMAGEKRSWLAGWLTFGASRGSNSGQRPSFVQRMAAGALVVTAVGGTTSVVTGVSPAEAARATVQFVASAAANLAPHTVLNDFEITTDPPPTANNPGATAQASGTARTDGSTPEPGGTPVPGAAPANGSKPGATPSSTPDASPTHTPTPKSGSSVTLTPTTTPQNSPGQGDFAPTATSPNPASVSRTPTKPPVFLPPGTPDTPEPTETATPTGTPTPGATNTPTPSPTATGTPTSTRTPRPSPTSNDPPGTDE